MGGNTLADPNNPNNSIAATAGATAIGYQAKANDVNTTAIGNGASASYAGSVAIGAGAKANADPTTAVGNNAIANGVNSVALGANTTANGNNSVALGQGSVANRANSVSVGDAATGLQRQITNVAPGTMPNDAVNLGQLQGMINQASINTLNQANRYANRVAAMAAATSITPMFGPKGYSLTATMASVGSQGAIGIGFAHSFHIKDNPAYWQASVGFNGGGTAAVKVGASIGW
jgi:autotransporter adhesin